MRLTVISDLHGHLPKIEPCDLLLIAGDICPTAQAEKQAKWLDKYFVPWLDMIPVKEVGLTWGNHDFVGQQRLWPPDMPCTVLIDDHARLAGLQVYGSPWTVRFFDWAFMQPDWKLEAYWASIPAGVDILLVHQPPFRMRDRTRRGDYVGSETLADHVTTRIKPKLLVCGHIHEDNGINYPSYAVPDTVVVNASFVDHNYDPGQPIWSFEWQTIEDIISQSKAMRD
jgi:3',5'-cyclic AMP phosphodiesterase CpdA